MNRLIRVHMLGAMPKGNVGTVAAQRALYRLLMDTGKIDLSVSVTNEKVFKLYHPEFKDKEVYGPLARAPSIGSKVVRNHMQWAFFTFLNLPLSTFTAILIQIGVKLPYRTEVINRMKECDVFIDLNLELLKGIPISVSSALIKQKPRIFVIHKLFWSVRMFRSLWFIFVVKGIFKKKLVVGPASFGPFKGLPAVTQWLVRFILNRFVDLILVREPYSAKLLDELGVKNYLTTADVALVARALKANSSSSRCNFFPLSKPTIGFAPAMFRHTLTKEETDNYTVAHAKCIDDLIKEYDANIVFLPSSSDDITMCKAIKAKMGNKHHTKLVITDDVDAYESWIRRLNLIITTRMHPSIIAAINFIPFSTIIYDHKQLGFLQQIGLQSFSMPIGKTSYCNLKVMINHAIQNWSKIKETLESALPKLQDETIMTIRSTLNLTESSKAKLMR